MTYGQQSGAPEHTYSDGQGNMLYTYSDGSREATDGYGTVVRDADGDGNADLVSVDGGNTWTGLSN